MSNRKLWLYFLVTFLILISITSTYAWFYVEIVETSEIEVATSTTTIVNLSMGTDPSSGALNPAVAAPFALQNNEEELLAADKRVVGPYIDVPATVVQKEIEVKIIGPSYCIINYTYTFQYNTGTSQSPIWTNVDDGVIGIEIAKPPQGFLPYERNPIRNYQDRTIFFDIWFLQVDEVIDHKYKNAEFNIVVNIIATQVDVIEPDSYFSGITYDFYEIDEYNSELIGIYNENIIPTTGSTVYLAPFTASNIAELETAVNNNVASKIIGNDIDYLYFTLPTEYSEYGYLAMYIVRGGAIVAMSTETYYHILSE